MPQLLSCGEERFSAKSMRTKGEAAGLGKEKVVRQKGKTPCATSHQRRTQTELGGKVGKSPGREEWSILQAGRTRGHNSPRKKRKGDPEDFQCKGAALIEKLRL